MPITTVLVPELGGDSKVVVIEILVKVGDTVGPDTTVVTLESDKATMDVPAGESGVITQLNVKIGDTIASGSALLTLENSQDKPEIASHAEQPVPVEVAAIPVAPASTVEDTTLPVEPDPEETSTDDVHAGPAVRRMAREFGVDLTAIVGTGFKKRILIEDVQAYVKTKLANMKERNESQSLSGLEPLPVINFANFGEITTVPLSRLKKLSGRNLHRNWVSIPHVTQFANADITDLLEYRQQHKDRLAAQEGIKLTLLVFIMQAVVKALVKFPAFNSSLDPSLEQLILKKYYNIGVAVDTPEGLVVPVIRDVNLKSIGMLAKELHDISSKARNKRLMPADLQGGCFSISSLGGIGGTAFTPIINAPEVAILGLSMVNKQPIYQANGELAPRMILPLSLSYDHRVIDGAEAARFIVYLNELLSDIRHLLL